MRLLLPPSEGKTGGGRGASLLTRGFEASALGEHRQVLCGLVESVSAGPSAAAAAAFLMPPAVADDALAANARVLTAPTRRALERYAGVVFDGLGYAELPTAAQRLALRSILIFSGLFGVVTGGEPIPDYRVPAAAKLPDLGLVGSSWRPILNATVPAILGKSIVVDLRSTDYQAMWRPSGALAERVITVRMLSRRPNGSLAVVSYFSKYGKGQLARALLLCQSSGAAVTSAADVVSAWTTEPGRDGDVVVTAGRTRVDLVSAQVAITP